MMLFRVVLRELDVQMKLSNKDGGTTIDGIFKDSKKSRDIVKFDVD